MNPFFCTFLFLFCLFFSFSGAVFSGDCRRVGSVCVDNTPVKNIQGLNITVGQIGGCWAFEDTYECRSATTTNDCQPLRDQGCGQIGMQCVDKDDKGVCTLYEYTYQCPDQPETVTEKTVCNQTAFCLEGGAGCFNTHARPDQDFGQAVTMMEVARQAGVYGPDPDRVELFKGYSETCSVKVLGGSTIKNCCKSTKGGNAFSNHAILSAGTSAAGGVGRAALAMGSQYVYDTLYSQVDSALIKRGLKAMHSGASGLGPSTFKPQFGLYGFTFDFSLANGFKFSGFDPSSFAISIAVLLIQEWLRCDQSEQIMAMKRGQNLCVHVETYCSKKVLKVCLEKKERHCCFHSKLAKLINRQGRAQIGMLMDQCNGFNSAQLQSIDFSNMDLTEFVREVMPKERPASEMTSKVKTSVSQRVLNQASP